MVGSKAEVISNAAPIMVKGEMVGAVVVFQDITEVLHLTEELRRSTSVIHGLKHEIKQLQEGTGRFEDIVSKSPKMKGLIALARRAAWESSPILISGETGTGKDTIANALHFESPKDRGPLIKVNCASMSADLLEAELFGCEAGALPGVEQLKVGKLELASGGNIYLDEVGEADHKVQGKLLSVLQEGRLLRVGGTEPVPVEVRVICSTSRDLSKLVEQGKFREDGQQVAIVAGDPFYRDEMNHRAMLYDDEGKFIAHLLTDFGIGSFLSPKSAAHLGGRWYVLDLDIISAFNSRGQFITSFGGRGRGPGDFGVYDNFGQEEGPAAMVSSKFGHLLVSDTYNHRIQLIDKDGRFKGAFEADRPGALCEDANGNIYVVSPHRGVVTKYSSTGEKLLEFGKPGSGEGEFTRENQEGITYGPSGIAVHPKTGLVYVSDTEAHRIQVFDPQGNFLKVLGGFGATEKGFFNPGGLAFDEEGYLWVADTGNHRVIQLDVK